MAVRFYDDAIVNKITKWIKDPNMKVLKPDETSRLFQMLADEKNDKPLTLPIVAISREKEIEIEEVKKQPKTFNGIILKSNDKVHIPINVIPIKLRYQLDIYTRTINEVDEYVRNFVFNFINYPYIKIEIPYNNCNIEHNATIYLDPSITDNSDIKEKLFPDEFQRYTLKFTISDAYLFSLPINNNVIIKEVNLNVDRIDYNDETDKFTEVTEESEVIYTE